MFGIKSIACEYDLRGRKTYEGGATYPVRYEYDSDANISQIDYPDATLAFTHDADGSLTSASNTVGVVSNEYDSVTGWLVSSHGADGVDVSYTYHFGGGVASMASPAGVVSNTLDVAGRKSALFTSAGNIGFGYCPWNGRLAVVTNANGTTTSYAYDVMDRVTNITWTTVDGSRIGGFSYVYDAIGRIVSRSHDLGVDVFNRTYTYDDFDRLASDGDVSYTYDAAGNRMTKTGDVEGDVSYTLGTGNRLQSWTGGSYTYNDAGCVTRIERVGKPTLDLTWDSQYQLISVATNGVFAEGYAYDALGRRVATTTQQGTIRHIYDNNWQCIADVDVNGNVLRSYIWGDGIDNLLAVKIGDDVYTALTDIQGTVWGFTDVNGDVVARWTYDAWGNVLSSDVTVPALAALRYRFQGREWSVVTGLMNFRMRWYDAVTGKWLSKDPMGMRGGMNQYAFCNGNPVVYIDCLGLAKRRKSGDAEEEKELIRILHGFHGGLVFDSLLAFKLHSGGEYMDYKSRENPSHWQFPDGRTRRRDEFGNYMADYDAGYSDNPLSLYVGVRLGGMAYGGRGSSEGWCDSGSVPDINEGFADGVVEKAVDDVMNDPVVSLITVIIDMCK